MFKVMFTVTAVLVGSVYQYPDFILNVAKMIVTGG